MTPSDLRMCALKYSDNEGIYQALSVAAARIECLEKERDEAHQLLKDIYPYLDYGRKLRIIRDRMQVAIKALSAGEGM